MCSLYWAITVVGSLVRVPLQLREGYSIIPFPFWRVRKRMLHDTTGPERFFWKPCPSHVPTGIDCASAPVAIIELDAISIRMAAKSARIPLSLSDRLGDSLGSAFWRCKLVVKISRLIPAAEDASRP